MLKFETKTVHEVDAFDLDQFIAETYGFESGFEGTLESPNDSTHAFTVHKGAGDHPTLGQYHKADLEKIKARQNCEYYSIGKVLNDLADRDLIPEGDWIVSVCW